MTLEEAIEILEDGAWWDMVNILLPCGGAASAALRDAVDMALAALRAQQEPVRLDRSRWEGCETCKILICATCQYTTEDSCDFPCFACQGGTNKKSVNYCPNCGCPLAEEAWAELERRMAGG